MILLEERLKLRRDLRKVNFFYGCHYPPANVGVHSCICYIVLCDLDCSDFHPNFCQFQIVDRGGSCNLRRYRVFAETAGFDHDIKIAFRVVPSQDHVVNTGQCSGRFFKGEDLRLFKMFCLSLDVYIAAADAYIHSVARGRHGEAIIKNACCKEW